MYIIVLSNSIHFYLICQQTSALGYVRDISVKIKDPKMR